MSRPRLLLLNAGLFQLGWLTCVLGAQHPWWLLIALSCLAAQLRWVARQPDEWCLVLKVAAIGGALDSLLMHLGVFDFGAGNGLLLPLWLAILWLLFATTLRHCLFWTARPWWLGSVLGALGGPLSYLGGARIAAVELPLGTWQSLLLIAAIWAVLLPLLHQLAAPPASPQP